MHRLFLIAILFSTCVASSVASAAERKWYKGNLHTHSLWSDGNDFPEMIADWYARTATTSSPCPTTTSSARAQKWIGVAEGDKRAGDDGFDRYRKRFRGRRVETRNRGRRRGGPAQAAGRVPRALSSSRASSS